MAHSETDLWHRGAVIYQIYPRSFQDTDGDGVGDLPGITQRLDYVAALGVDGIWISPFFTSPMHDFGYDVADYCAVDPLFGTLEDFDALIARAHELGLKVIIDQVYCHTSDEHDWFKQSRASRENEKADWYVWADAEPDGSPPSNWQSVFGGPAWRWDGRRKQYYLHNFLASQPQLNLHKREVQDALLEAARFWLARGVDGFRVDAINFAMHDPALTDNPPSNLPLSDVTRPFDMQLHAYNQSHKDIPVFLERLRSLLDEFGATFSVAEVVGAEPLDEMKSFTGDRRLHTAYNFDFLYLPELSAQAVREALEPFEADGRDVWPSWAFSNHDAPRAVSRWSQDKGSEDFAKCLMLLILAFRGNIFLYQGEELALPQGEIPFEKLQDPEAIENWPHTLGRDGARTPMVWQAETPHGGFSTAEPWLPVSADQSARSAEKAEAEEDSILHFTRKLIAFRKDSAALLYGDLIFLDTAKDILAFIREADGEKILCLFNLSDTERTFHLPDGYEAIFKSPGIEIEAGKLPAWSGAWLKMG